MWSSDRRTLLAALAATGLAAGCGFTPAYAPGGSATRLHDQVLPAAPFNRLSYVFATRIEDQLGHNDAAPYLIEYEIDTNVQRLAITPEQETLRYHLEGQINYRVVERSTNKVLTRGDLYNFTAYAAIGTTVATRASQKYAGERLMLSLADQLVSRLIITADSWLP